MFSTSAFAQELPQIFEFTKTMKCSKVEHLMSFLNEKFGETMAWVGKDENTASYIAIYKNKETGTWSMIQYDTTYGCFIGSGTQGSPT